MSAYMYIGLWRLKRLSYGHLTHSTSFSKRKPYKMRISSYSVLIFYLLKSLSKSIRSIFRKKKKNMKELPVEIDKRRALIGCIRSKHQSGNVSSLISRLSLSLSWCSSDLLWQIANSLRILC